MNKTEIEKHRRLLINLVKEKDLIIKEKDLIIKEQKTKIDKATEYIKDKLSSLNMNKSAIMRIVEPSTGHLLADVNYEIQKWKRLLELLGGE